MFSGDCLRRPRSISRTVSTTAADTGVGTPCSRPFSTTYPFIPSISVGRPLATSWAIDAFQLRPLADFGVSISSSACQLSRRPASAHCSAVVPLILGIV